MKVVGIRRTDTSSMTDQAGLAKTAALLRGTAALAPRGVYRFSSFEEADAWMTQTILRTHARLSRKTSAAEVADGDVREHTVVRVVDEVIVGLMGRACGLAERLGDASGLDLIIAVHTILPAIRSILLDQRYKSETSKDARRYGAICRVPM